MVKYGRADKIYSTSKLEKKIILTYSCGDHTSPKAWEKLS